MAEVDPLSPDFDVELDGETYTFRKPGIRFRMEMGYKAADIRRRAYPPGFGAMPGDFGIDNETVGFSRACAVLELYLQRASAAWPFSPGADGKPVVDFDKFPPEREDTVWKLFTSFDTAVARFRTRGDSDKPLAGA